MYVDGFRFITRLNTQVRTLVTLSQIVKILGAKQLPKQFLKSALEKWSAEEESKSIEYKKHKGKITKEGKPTTAFNRYLEFITALGLVTTHSDLVMCSRSGILLNRFANESKHTESQLSATEKIFFLITLFSKDADALLLTLELLQLHNKPVSQKDLRESFKENLKHRLSLKQKYANQQVRPLIHDQYRKVEYEWRGATSYAEHIIPPRLEWMRDLDILKQVEKGSFYQLTEQGETFYKSLPYFPNTEQHDINEIWLRTKMMTTFAHLIFYPKRSRYWNDLVSYRQQQLLVPLLDEIFNLLNNEGARRISLYPSLLFIAIKLACTHQVIAEIQELENTMKESVIAGHKKFSARPAPRINEGYITVNLV